MTNCPDCPYLKYDDHVTAPTPRAVCCWEDPDRDTSSGYGPSSNKPPPVFTKSRKQRRAEEAKARRMKGR